MRIMNSIAEQFEPPGITRRNVRTREITLQESRRLYIHYYYNIDKAAEDEKAFDRRLIALKHELESGKRVPRT